jgi:hypothetical protein
MNNDTAEIDKERLWEEQRDFRRLFDERGGIDKYFFSLDEDVRRELFHRTDLRIGCMDEGCVDCGYRLAGSGVLIADPDKEAFLDNCRLFGVNGVTYHEGCGADPAFASRLNGGGKPDELLKDSSEQLARALKVDASFISAEKMSRPKDFHSVRFAYYDGTGRLNLKNAAGILPNGFVLTRALYPKAKYAVAEVALAYEMASGPRGFGELITPDEPFEIIVIGDKDNPETTQKKLEHELSPLKANPKININGFEVSKIIRIE